jgi:hypothetical protein
MLEKRTNQQRFGSKIQHNDASVALCSKNKTDMPNPPATPGRYLSALLSDLDPITIRIANRPISIHRRRTPHHHHLPNPIKLAYLEMRLKAVTATLGA